MSNSYSVLFTESAKDDLAQLDRTAAARILKKISRLANNAMVIAHYALSGTWQGYYRLRVGDYRIIYTLEHAAQTIIVQRIGHRKEIYEG